MVKSIDDFGVTSTGTGSRPGGATGRPACGIAHRGVAGASSTRSAGWIWSPTCRCPATTEVYVVGDLALVMQDGKPVPGWPGGAPGRASRRVVLVAALSGKAFDTFRYKDKGMRGHRGAAPSPTSQHRPTGFPAWVIWAPCTSTSDGFRTACLMAHWSWGLPEHAGGLASSPDRPAPEPLEKPRH